MSWICRCRAKREQLNKFQGLSPESRGQNLALTVLYVPSCGTCSPRVKVKDALQSRRVSSSPSRPFLLSFRGGSSFFLLLLRTIVRLSCDHAGLVINKFSLLPDLFFCCRSADSCFESPLQSWGFFWARGFVWNPKNYPSPFSENSSSDGQSAYDIGCWIPH